MTTSRNIKESDVKVLYARAAGRCSFQDCRADLTMDSANGGPCQIGEIAHIHAHSDTGPRSDSTASREERAAYSNLILLCPTCHAKIDRCPDKYPAEMLFDAKQNHERWVRESMDENMSCVTFSELDVAAKALVSSYSIGSQDFIAIPIKDKLSRNGLSMESEQYISMGLSISRSVSQYLTQADAADSNFSKRLIAGFKDQYAKLQSGFTGDELFMQMYEYTMDGCRDYLHSSARLAILAYLFHICEVFER